VKRHKKGKIIKDIMARRIRLKKIIKIGRRALKRGRIPLYWSKYSRKDFTIHQHIMIQLKKALGMR